MDKFKVGDKVRIKSGMVIYGQYGGLTAYPRMVDAAGKIGTITEVTRNYYVMPFGFYFSPEMLEPAEPKREFIVIRRDGQKTIAELRHDKEVIKSGVARCNPNDEFNFQFGSMLAFSRLMAK